LLMTVTGVNLARRRAVAVGVSLVLLILAALWSWHEAGADFWAWVPRIIAFLVVALVSVAASPLLRRKDGTAALAGRAAASLASLFVIVLVGLFGSMFVAHPTVSATGVPSPVLQPDAGDDLGTDWAAFGRGTNGNRFVQFDQINKGNISHLKEAWRFRTGDMAINGAEYQGTSLKIDNTLYMCTPHNIVFALDPVTGEKRWEFDPHVAETAGNKSWARCRGLGYFDAGAPTERVAPDTQAAQAVDCRKRIIMTTIDARLLAIDADSGQLCEGFGDHGSVNLLDHLGARAPGDYYPTSAPLVAGNVIVVGGKLNDNLSVGEPSGVIRGYDVTTGKQLWGWDPMQPKRGTAPLAPGETYAGESPNFWGTASYDPTLGLAFIPTGNQTPDFWNGNRHPGSDEYNDSIVAIDVKTGIDKWHFRTANQDMFDYDVSSQPILYDMPGDNGGTTPVVIAPTKRGQIFVLDRRTGTPVVPVEERKVATDGMPGMHISPTQPFSAISVGGTLTEKDMWGASIFDQLYCRIQFKQMHWEGEFTPLNDTKNTLIYPGYYGGFNWGGGALDPTTGTLIINDIRMAQWGRFIRREEAARLGLKATTEGEYSEQLGTPWGVVRSMFMSPLGVPCFKPPFGSMTAINLATGKTQWQVPMGSIQDAPVHGVVPGVKIPLGMPTMGGPLVTKSGLTFFFGTLDYYIRALDNATGKEVWSSRLPVGGQGAPMSYIGADGKQYIVITVGGATRTGTNTNRGDYVIAYALDENTSASK
jgi:quinate dehydrogenase (quinone)